MLKASLNQAYGENVSGFFHACLILVVSLFVLSACAPAKTDQELKKDVQTLKTEVAALKEKMSQLEAGQKQVLDTLKEFQKPGEMAVPAPPSAMVPAMPQPAPPSAPLSISQLLKDKDRLIGSRVTVKGDPGPVLMHKKTFYLQAPEGMVEVSYANLADKKQIERLNSHAIETPVTVTGMLTASPGRGKDPTRLVITADSVDF